MKRLISVGLSLVLSASLIPDKPAKANPAALAPAVCATGVGCVAVGVVVVSGVAYYWWRFGGGKEVLATASGQVWRVLVDPENPEGWQPGRTARVGTEQACYNIAKKYGKKVIKIKQVKAQGGIWYDCTFDK